MATGLRGGHRITSIAYISATAVRVRFTSSLTGKLYQLYIGRRRVAVTEGEGQREIVAQYSATRYPEVFSLVAVDHADKLTDYGDSLPKRAYIRARVTFNTTGWSSDADLIKLFRSDAPGGAVNITTPRKTILYAGEKTYTMETDPLQGSGTWNIEVAGYDNRPNGGNKGTVGTGSVTVIATPPDLEQSSGERFSISMDTGTATITTTLPAD